MNFTVQKKQCVLTFTWQAFKADNNNTTNFIEPLITKEDANIDLIICVLFTTNSQQNISTIRSLIKRNLTCTHISSNRI